MGGDEPTDGRRVVLAELRQEGEGQKSLDLIRELELDEAQEIRTASRLIQLVARARGFRRLQQLASLVLERLEIVESRGKPAPHEIQALLAGVRALIEARTQFLTHVESLGADRHAAGPDAERDHTVRAGKETKSAAEGGGASQTGKCDTGAADWATLERLNSDPDKLRRDRKGVIGVLAATGQLVALRATVHRAAFQAQSVFIAALASVATDVAAAGRKLRQLHVEAPEGRPVLVNGWPSGSEREKMRVAPEELPIEDVGEAMRLTRTAKDLLEAPPAFPAPPETLDEAKESESEQEREVGTTASADNAAVHAVDDEGREMEKKAVGGVSGRSEAGADATPTSGDVQEKTGSEGPAQPPAPVDLPGLLRLARSLNDDLAQAWSDGLDRAQTEAGIARQRVAVQGALAAVARHFQQERRMIKQFPPSLARLAELEASADLAGEALATAQIAAVTNVVNGLRPLSEPTVVQVKFGQEGPQSLKRFWDSGAFAQLADHLDLLGRLLEPEYAPEVAARAATFHHLRQAQAAWHAGDPEACLVHAVAGLNAYFGVALDALEKRITEESVLQDDGRAVVAAGTRLVARLIDGEPVLALAVLLAPALNDLLVELCRPQPYEDGMTADELFELVAKDLPFEFLGNDEPS